MNNQTNTNTSAPQNPKTPQLQNFVTPFPAFTQAVSRHEINPRRLHKFFNGFSEALQSAGTSFPDHETANGEYYDSISAALSIPSRLPAPVRAALLTLEAAALPENAARLEDAIQRRIPNVSLHGCCPIDCALELWFLVPDELAQFQPPAEAVPAAPPNPQTPKSPNSAPTDRVPGIEHPASSPPLTDPLIHSLTTPTTPPASPSLPNSISPTLHFPPLEPWPEPVDGKTLLDALVALLNRFVVLPKYAAETLALWIVHTYAFQLRDVSTYIGLESPEKQCGKTTLLTVLSELANRAVTASNISPPAFFRVIEDLCPTLLIDEGDTFLQGNEQLRGILNAGYKRKTGFVLRAGPLTTAAPALPLLGGPRIAECSTPVGHQTGGGLGKPLGRVRGNCSAINPSIHQSNQPDPNGQVSSFSCWCPKVIATIGRLPDTLADRCIVIRMQRKTRHEECERLRNLDAEPLKQQCARFVLDHQPQIAAARPEFPASLSDRACDIWEPLLALADLAGGDWPQKARQAAVNLAANAQETNPIGTLLLDIFLLFVTTGEKKMFTRALVQGLIAKFVDRPWAELSKGRPITNQWLAQQLRPYGIKPRTIWIGDQQAKGYAEEDFQEIFRRYIPRSELEAILAEARKPQPDNAPDNPTVAPADNSLAA